jgi:hypothetical protein
MRIKIAVYIAISLISAVIFLAGLQLPSVWSRVVSAIPVVVVGLFAVFDRWVWKWAFVPQIVQRPVIHGTWHGKIESDWKSGADSPSSEYEAFLVVTQTFTTLQVTLISKASKSRSVVSEITKNASDDFSVFYHYGNTPRRELRDGSPIHMGGVSIEVFSVRPKTIEGEYWTSRNSGGSLSFQYVSKDRIGSFEEGLTLMKDLENK